MSNEMIAINTLSAVIGALLIIFFLKALMDLKIEKKNIFIFVLTFSLLNGYISSLLFRFAPKPLVLMIVSVIIIKYLLNTSFLHSFVSFAAYTISMAIGNAVIPVFARLVGSDLTVETLASDYMALLLANIFVNLLAFLIILMIKPLKSYIRIVQHNKFIIIFTGATFMVLCSSFALNYFMIDSNITAYLIIAAITISYCIFVFVIWFYSLRKAVNDEDLAQQKFYNESLRSTMFELRRFKHDWSNNLTVINSMLKMDKISELKQYTSELIAQNSEHSLTEIYNLKNAGLFGIISSKINQSKEKGINVDFSIIGEIENIPGVKISELCEIVGIFLDNAIEESLKAEKFIGIKIQNNNSFLEITISNSCLSAPDFQMIYRDGYSTKGENRGMGLAIAKKLIGKYKNILHTTAFEENIFSQTLEIVNRKGL